MFKKKNLPANARHLRDTGSTPRLGKPSGGGQASHASIPALRILWTEEPGGLQSIVSQRVGHD